MNLNILISHQKFQSSSTRKLFNDLRYLKIAKIVSDFSHAQRKKVGAVIVSPDGKIVGTGYNGTPSKTNNCCEIDNVTKPEVIHAELNAIFNATTQNLEDSTLYLTYSPCVGCASAIVQKKFKRVVYFEPYRILDGVEYCENNGVRVDTYQEIDEELECRGGK